MGKGGIDSGRRQIMAMGFVDTHLFRWCVSELYLEWKGKTSAFCRKEGPTSQVRVPATHQLHQSSQDLYT